MANTTAATKSTTQGPMGALRQKLDDLGQLKAAISALQWDKEVMMPMKGSGPRAAMLSYLAGDLHEKATSKEFRTLIDEARAAAEAKELTPQDAAIVREVWREISRQEKLPVEFVKEITQVTSEAHYIWIDARKKKDFQIFAPQLRKIVDLKKREAELVGFTDSPYDALLDTFEPYATTKEIAATLGDLRNFLSPFLAKIRAAKQVDTTPIEGEFDVKKQNAFCTMAIRRIGYDFDAGRLDVSAHPFSTTFHPLDTRITTRYSSDELMQSIGGAIHETGHALYDQGLPAAYFGTPLGEAVSLGIHESQSRMWENLVGKSRAFWTYFYPLLQGEFPALAKVPQENFYRAVNAVGRSFIRVESDEVSYNLHIILRFEIEKALIEGDIDVPELPAIWNAKMKDLLGLDVPDDGVGVLQDVHWSSGSIGYFPTYSLGNLYSAQFFAKAKRDLPGLDEAIARGEFNGLVNWLRENIHVHGKFYTAGELVEHVTGEKLNSKYFAEYIAKKYGEIYGI